VLPKAYQIGRLCLGFFIKMVLALLKLREGIEHYPDLVTGTKPARGPVVQFLELIDHLLVAIRHIHIAMSHDRLNSHPLIILIASFVVMHEGNASRDY